MWSSFFARQVAEALGYCVSAASEKPGAISCGPPEEHIVNKVAEAFRYLPAEKIQLALDYAEFLRKEKIENSWGPPSARASWVAEKLCEVRDLVCFLRHRYGATEPADERDYYWTDEDWQEVLQEGRRRLTPAIQPPQAS
jgi:hypothetical protein